MLNLCLRICWCAFIHVIDFIFDVLLVCQYYEDKQYVLLTLTIIFPVVSLILMVIYNYRDYKRLKSSNEPVFLVSETVGWVVWCSIFFFPLNVILRFVECLIYCWRFRSAKHQENEEEKLRYRKLMNNTKTTLLWIQLREAFLESGPQLCLQLFAISSGTTSASYAQLIMVTSVISLGHVLESSKSHLQSLDASVTAKIETTWTGYLLLTFAQVTGIAARVLAIGLSLSVRPWCTVGLVGAHIVFVLSLLLWKVPDIYSREQLGGLGVLVKPLNKFLLLLLFSIVSIFGYVHNNKRFRLVWYWLLCLVENISLMVLWWWHRSDERPAQQRWALQDGHVWVVIALIIFNGLLFAIFYRCKSHLTKGPDEAKNSSARDEDSAASELLTTGYSSVPYSCNHKHVTVTWPSQNLLSV